MHRIYVLLLRPSFIPKYVPIESPKEVVVLGRAQHPGVLLPPHRLAQEGEQAIWRRGVDVFDALLRQFAAAGLLGLA